jgi:hypothetical protein
MGKSIRTWLGRNEETTKTMTPRQQWEARQRIREMIEELEAMPPHGGRMVTINAMQNALEFDLTDEHWDTLQRRFAGHKRILAGEI